MDKVENHVVANIEGLEFLFVLDEDIAFDRVGMQSFLCGNCFYSYLRSFPFDI